MLIILEGADGSGKTSLATRLRKELKQYCLQLSFHHLPTLTQIAEVTGWLQHLPPNLPVITDRTHLISEYVYGPILRGKCLHALNVKQIARWIKPAMLVHCRPNRNALAAGVQHEPQMEGVVNYHKEIIRAYDVLMGDLEKEGVYVKRYDYTGPPQLLLDSIRDYIQGEHNG